jgi:hypothetical protein
VKQVTTFPKLPTSFSLRSPWHQLLGETRTRILLLYAITLLAVVGGAVPIFRTLLFQEVDERVRADLLEELEDFATTYESWDAQDPETDEALTAFIEDFTETNRPEDDNFHLVVFNGDFFRANPSTLPSVISPDSDLVARWRTLTEATEGKVNVADSTVSGS